MSTPDPKLVSAVTEDTRCHRENGVDLNPYSTIGSRWSWDHGFKGAPKRVSDYDTPYQRGQLAAKMLAEQKSPESMQSVALDDKKV